MAKKIVRIPYIVWSNVTIDTDLDDDDEIIEQVVHISRFVRNCDRTIGTQSPDVTIEACDTPYETDDGVVKITVEDDE